MPLLCTDNIRAVTVLWRVCSVQVTASLIIFPKNTCIYCGEQVTKICLLSRMSFTPGTSTENSHSLWGWQGRSQLGLDKA